MLLLAAASSSPQEAKAATPDPSCTSLHKSEQDRIRCRKLRDLNEREQLRAFLVARGEALPQPNENISGCHLVGNPARWSARKCCTPRRSRSLDTNPWPQASSALAALAGTSRLHFPREWAPFVQHTRIVEPLTVAAFVAAIERAKRRSGRGWVVDIGANLGYYTLLANRLAPSFQVFSVEMQPLCADVTACALFLNSGRPAGSSNVTLLNAYVSSQLGPPIAVPSKACDTMASPTAVGGRRPGGALRGTSAPKRLNASVLVPVPPVLLGEYLLRHILPGERVAAVKIDTEGFEARVIESLRPAWHLLEDIVMELQPAAWVYHNLSFDAGVSTLRDLVAANSYRVVSLPMRKAAREKNKVAAPSLVDICALLKSTASSADFKPARVGLNNATVFDGNQLESYIRQLTLTPKRFADVLLTRRRCM